MTNRCVHRYKKGPKKGERCGLTAVKASYLCHNHQLGEEEKEARKKKGKRSRRKGSTFERDIANQLKPIFPNAKRAGLRQTQSGSDDAPDVDGCPPFWIETKHGKKTNPRAALAQAEEAMAAWATKGGSPEFFRWALAVCKDDRQPTFVMMRWDQFMEFLSEWQNNGKESTPT